MTLTIEQMYEMQKELDAKIIKEKGLEGQDLLQNTVLALQVEIGELANEWRGFKHWSDRRQPRYGLNARIPCDGCGGRGFWFDGERETCTICNAKGEVFSPLIMEYVDCLHFFLSIARQLDLSQADLNVHITMDEAQTAAMFTELLNLVGLLNGESFWIKPEAVNKPECFRCALAIFLRLGEQCLGFSFEQIAEAYAAKNAVNHERQTNGY
ncbi:dUTP diphosphatase [Paenibacillus lautus]|uniref:dUTP diphosphatase n=1 Tax=Paenibacillus lautus TaxID=1401 RepID=UPI00384E66D1